MIKPDEIRSIEFDMSVLGGYKRESVDAFFGSVVSDYEKIYNENIELAKKLKVCIEKIEEYQKDERFLRAAIINAEKLNETSLKEIEAREKEIEQTAKEKAEALVANANLEADNILTKAKVDADNIVNKAKLEAADSIRKCEIEANEKITQINAEIAIENDKLLILKKQVSDFKDNILKIYKSHLESISKLPEYTPETAVVHEEPKVSEAVKYEEPIPKKQPEFIEEYNPEPQSKSKPATKEIEHHVKDNIHYGTFPEAGPKTPAVHNSEKEKTAEFVIDKKKTSTEKNNSFDENFKFQGLKFGTDFNVENDE